MLDVAKAHERRWWTLAVLCISLVVIAVDTTILNVALPTIARDLHTSGSDLSWIIDSYTIVFSGLLLTAGALGDRFGRKGALTIGLAWFAVFSVVASVAPSAGVLCVARGLMGVGAALIYPTTLSIITNTFHGPERAKAIGVWAGCSGVGLAIGPLGGGFLVEHFSWGAVFLVNVPICVGAIALGYFLVPTSRDPEPRALDPVGALLSIAAVAALLYGIIQGPDAGWSAPQIVIAFVSGLTLLVAFIAWELHTDHPLLDLRIFRNPRFSAASATVTLNTFALVGAGFLLTQYFQFVLGYSPFKAGVMSTPVAIGLMVAAPNAARLVFRFGTKRVVVGGLVLTAAVLCTYASDTIMSSFVLGAITRLFFGLGIGFTVAPATESIMGALPRERAGVGSAVNDTTRQTGASLGVAVLGSVLLAQYHHVVPTLRQLPASVNAAVHDSIATAITKAATLRDLPAHAVRDAARAAFIDAMRYAYAVGAISVLLAAAVAWRYLPALGAPEAEPDVEP